MRDIRECIVYEDDDICVCHKPSGVLTQSDRGFSQDMVSALMTYERKKGVKAPFIAPVNRLDRPVEGLVRRTAGRRRHSPDRLQAARLTSAIMLLLISPAGTAWRICKRSSMTGK